jgi:hypothetical protein
MVTALPILDDRDVVRLPKTQVRRMQRIRDKMLADLADAADDLGVALDGDVRRTIAAIRRSDYNPQVIERQVHRLMDRHYGRLGEALAGQIEVAATLGLRYAEHMDAFAVQYINPRPFAETATARVLAEGRQQATTALSTEVLLSQPATRAPARFLGDKLLREHVKPWSKARVVSSQLHGRGVQAGKEVASQAMAAVRESKQLTAAATDMIREVRKAGVGELAKGQKVSKLMQRVEKAGRDLNTRGGEKALKEWQTTRRQMRSYVRRLAEGGRVRSSLEELLQRTSDTSAKGIDRAIRQHAAFKQKYAAERILKTEQMAAFKSQQVLSDRKHDWIVGYIWRMNRSARSGFARRVKPRRKFSLRGQSGGRRRRCVCESLNGTRLSKEAVAGKTARLMAHPHCMCYLEPIMDQKRLRAPITDEELMEFE